jgi:hypothetical protein
MAGGTPATRHRNALAGPEGSGRWRRLIDEQIHALQERIQRMEAARELLEHVASHHEDAPDGCRTTRR